MPAATGARCMQGQKELKGKNSPPNGTLSGEAFDIASPIASGPSMAL
jgi:hypothetical protein